MRALPASITTLVLFAAMSGSAWGASLTTGCPGLQSALDQAANGDTITLNQLCTVDNSGLSNGQFNLSPASNPQSYTLVGAPGSGAGFDGTRVGDRVLIGANAPQHDVLTLRNLIFQNSTSTTVPGGGAIAFGGDYSVTLDHDTFTNNQTTNDWSGGAVEFDNQTTNDSLTVTHSTFIGNTAQNLGGAIDVETFGGAIPVSLSDNVFTNNQVDGCGGTCELDGGAVSIYNLGPGSAAVTQSGNSFTGNSIINGGGDVNGGAESLIGATLISTGDIFTGNSLQAPVSGQVSKGAALGIEHDCTAANPQETATNLALTGNSIADGGTAANADGALSVSCIPGFGGSNPSSLQLNGSTISGNLGGGGTAGVWGEPGDHLTLQNSILNGDSGGAELTGFNSGGGSTTATNTDLCNGTSPFTGTANICANPMLAGASSGDVHETYSSPTVDAGSNALVPNGLTTDVYGASRIQPRLAGGTATVDMGAAELSTVARPAASITTPASGAKYAVGQGVASSFSCTEGSGGPGISSCLDQNGHASGGSIDTSTAGTNTLTVTATSSDGLTATASITYTVQAPPSVSIRTPPGGSRYPLGQSVIASFSCQEGVGGPGLSSCVGTAANGSPIDTSVPGVHAFKVTATSSDGQVATRSIVYTVAPPDNRFVSPPKLKPHSDGRFLVTVKLPNAGRVDILVTAWRDNFGKTAAIRPGAAVVLQPASGRFVFARAQAIARGPGTLRIPVIPNARGRLLVANHRYRVTLRLWVTYTPAGGHPRTIGYYGLRLP
jgi:hypothetical protein